ncbi:hypothetical protein HAX54_009318, partial [Datura stramonium]|nr:hypothetical protein [Datura stramonium]
RGATWRSVRHAPGSKLFITRQRARALPLQGFSYTAHALETLTRDAHVRKSLTTYG